MITPKKIWQFGVFWITFCFIYNFLDKLPFFVNRIMIAFCGIFTIWETFPFSELHSPTKFSAGLHGYNCMPNCKGSRPQGHTPRKKL